MEIFQYSYRKSKNRKQYVKKKSTSIKFFSIQPSQVKKKRTQHRPTGNTHELEFSPYDRQYYLQKLETRQKTRCRTNGK